MVNATLAKEGLEWTLQKATATHDLKKMPALILLSLKYSISCGYSTYNVVECLLSYSIHVRIGI